LILYIDLKVRYGTRYRWRNLCLFTKWGAEEAEGEQSYRWCYQLNWTIYCQVLSSPAVSAGDFELLLTCSENQIWYDRQDDWSTQFSILNSQFSIPNSQFPIPNSPFSILHSPFLIHQSPHYGQVVRAIATGWYPFP